MREEDYFSEEEMAAILRIKKATLKQNRCLKKNHPPFVKVGNSILYPKSEFSSWKDSRIVRERPSVVKDSNE